MQKIAITFFGSGPVAAKLLELLSKDFEIVAVITKPKPKHHRGSFPVIDLANKLNIPTYLASNKLELSQLVKSGSFHTEIAILIDFGIIITQDAIDYFPKGIINSHFSLLPEWRGADPITFSILSGQKRTGVSQMLIDEGMDTGKLISQVEFNIPENITTPELTSKLIEISHKDLITTIPLWMSGKIKACDQKEVTIATSTKPTYSRKLTKQDGILDFSKTAAELEREIRAFIEWPKSRAKLAGIDVIITKAYTATAPAGDTSGPGYIVIDKQSGTIMIRCSKGYLSISKLKPAGKKEMAIKDFLAGYGQRLNAHKAVKVKWL